MDWIEAVITTKSEAVDALGGILLEAGITGFQIDDDEEVKKYLENTPAHWDYVDDDLLNKPISDAKIRFYVADDEYSGDIINNIQSQLKRLKSGDYGLDFGLLDIELVNVNDETWLDNWKKYYKPFRIGKNFIIKPSWEELEEAKESEECEGSIKKDNDIVLTLNPGHVFGTGLHQSTKMALISIERFIKPDMTIIDIGCGSGILAIGALLCGAGHAFLCDIESPAGEIVAENAGLNNIDGSRYEMHIGNLLSDDRLMNKILMNQHDIVVVNIVADIINQIVPHAKGFMKENAYIITSGIIKERQNDVRETLIRNGYKIILEQDMDEWVSITAQI